MGHLCKSTFRPFNFTRQTYAIALGMALPQFAFAQDASNTLRINTHRLGWTLIHSLWQFALVALIAIVALRIFRQASTNSRYSTLVGLMIALVACPILTWIYVEQDLARSLRVPNAAASAPVSPSEPSTSHHEIRPSAAIPADQIEGSDSVERQFAPMPNNTQTEKSWLTETPASRSVAAMIVGKLNPWLPTVVAVWIGGVLLFSVRLTLSWITVARLKSVGVKSAADSIVQTVQRLRARLRIGRVVHVLESSIANSPIVVGCLRSTILLPAKLTTTLTVEQLEAILAHELAHVRRYDFLTNLLQILVETLFFYHPAVWWLSNRIRIEREHCCDDLAVKVTGDRIAYGRALLALEELGQRAGLAMSARGGDLLTRVRRLFAKSPRSSVGDSVSSALVIASSILLVGLLLFQMPSRVAMAMNGQTGSASGDRPTASTDSEPFRLPDHWIIEDLRWTSGDSELVTVSLQGGVNVRTWNVKNRTLLSEIKLQSDVHGRPIKQGTLKLSANALRVIGVTDVYVGVWDAATGKLLRQIPIPKKDWAYDTVRTLACSPDGSTIVAGLETDFLRTTLDYPTYGIVWNGNTGEIISRFEDPHGFEFADICVSSDGKYFATCSRSNRIGWWEAATGKLLKDFSNFAQEWQSPDTSIIQNNLVRGLDLPANEKQLAIVGTFGIRLIDIDTGKLSRTIDAAYNINSADVVFNHDGTCLARFGARVQGGRDSVIVWSTSTGEQLGEIYASATVARFAGDSGQIAIGESDFYQAVSVWPQSSERTHQGPLPIVAYDRVNRVEENTHMRGEKAKQFADRWSLQWGQSQGGIQYGIGLTSQGNKFSSSQLIPMVVFLRNVSDRTLQFAFQPDMFGNPPGITRADGQQVELRCLKLLGARADYRDRLEPGEIFGPLYLNVALGKKLSAIRETWNPEWPDPEVGNYPVTHRAKIKIADSQANPNPTQPGWQQFEIATGTLGIEIESLLGDVQIEMPDQNSPRIGVSASKRENVENALAVIDAVKHPWRATGQVVDGNGKPLKGVTVRAATGVGTLLGGASVETDENGRYDLRFAGGISFGNLEDGKPSPQTQYALISASLEGHFEKNFSRQGNGIASLEEVSVEQLKHWHVETDQVCLPNKPREVNFVMLPAAKVCGVLIGANDQPLKDYSVMLTGKKLPPGSSVLAQVQTDENGRFKFDNIPTTSGYQFVVRKPRAELRPPWDDSWASSEFSFENPGDNDFKVLSNSDEETMGKATRIIAQKLALKIVGPGVHDNKAVFEAAKRSATISKSNKMQIHDDRIEAAELTLLLSNDSRID